MDELLFLLLKKGAHLTPLRISTTEIGKSSGMSQQNASRRLGVLEQMGEIERTKEGILITQKGLGQLKSTYLGLKQAFEEKGEARTAFKGRIDAGLKEGGYYLSLPVYKKNIKEKLGFVPFPGTLNIKLDKDSISQRIRLREMDPIIIRGFKEGNRAFGDIFAYKCLIDGKIPGAVILPLRTHHGMDVIELIAECNLKKKLNKKSGDCLTVTLV